MDTNQPTSPQPSSQQHPPFVPSAPVVPAAPQPAGPDPLTESKHRESVAQYPDLGLSQNEYVVTEVRRHPIGLLPIWAVVGIIVIATFALLPLYSTNLSTIADALMMSETSLPSPALLAVPLLLLTALVVIGGMIATYVYNSNRFYLTNESVIQHIRTSLFSRKEQHINLANIEDASYRQQGIFQHLLGYGSLRLSTEGDETTYRFHYVRDPQSIVHQVTEGIENATSNAARFRGDNQAPVQIGKH